MSGGSGRSQDRGNYDQNMLYENVFSMKENTCIKTKIKQ